MMKQDRSTPANTAKTLKRKKWKVLVVDDSATTRWLLVDHFTDLGNHTMGAESAEEALEIVDGGFEAQLAILDVELPGLNGIECLLRLKERLPEISAIILTVHDRATLALQALQAGACEYVLKPFSLEDLTQLALGVLREQQGRLSGSSGEDEPDEDGQSFIARSEIMEPVLRRIAVAAQAEGLTVLVTGETGTGKEVAARSIHRKSQRRDAPFVAVTCTALPEGLVESLLFGHERGAFTGAHAQRIGYFEQAHGGTLFLDEIGDLPLAAQAKFLRVLETGRLNRLGGAEEVVVDVRVIAATHRDLAEEVKKGTFRRDLYWRLAVLSVELPPLRARGDDLLLIARDALRRCARIHGHPCKRLSVRARNKLGSYGWPGNMRELCNVIERATLLSQTPVIDDKDIQLEGAPRTAGELIHSASEESLTLRELEARYMLRVLEDCDWHRGEAAKKLGVDPKTLYRFLKQRELLED